MRSVFRAKNLVIILGNVNEQRRPTGARLGHRRARRTRAMNPRNDRRDKPRDKDDPRRNDRHDRSGRGCVDGTNRTRFLVRRARFFFFLSRRISSLSDRSSDSIDPRDARAPRRRALTARSPVHRIARATDSHEGLHRGGAGKGGWGVPGEEAEVTLGDVASAEEEREEVVARDEDDERAEAEKPEFSAKIDDDDAFPILGGK